MRKISILGAGLIAAFLALVPVQAQTLEEKIKNDDVLVIPKGDPAMADAVRRAQGSLTDFLKILANPPPSTSYISVKIGIQDKGSSNTEFVWKGDLRLSGETFSGTIDNRPNWVKSYHQGDTIQFERSDIIDWTYFDGQRMRGHYTSCVLFKREKSAEAAKVIKQLKLDCDWVGK